MANTYCETGVVDGFAEGVGETRWTSLDDDSKSLIVYYASNDIEAFHGQPRDSFNTPWNRGNTNLRQACIEQSLFVMRTKTIREWKDRASVASEKSFNDSILSVDSINRNELTGTATVLTKATMKSMGIGAGIVEYGRG